MNPEVRSIWPSWAVDSRKRYGSWSRAGCELAVEGAMRVIGGGWKVRRGRLRCMGLLIPLLGALVAPTAVGASNAVRSRPLAILPPNNPSANVPEDVSDWCPDDNVTDCTNGMLHNINYARYLEGTPPMVLPEGYESMPLAQQELVVTNLERVGRGVALFSGLDPTLNAAALAGATADDDPVAPSGYPTDAWGSIWAGGFGDVLDANYGWMYDDGPGGQNGACQGSITSGCWGHRDNILTGWGTFGGRAAAMGAAEATTSIGASYAEIFASNTDGEPNDLEYTYADIPFPSTVPPDVIRIAPDSSSPAGGSTVTIDGNYFTGATSVQFNGISSPSFTVDWDGAITATVPRALHASCSGHNGGNPNVTVTTPTGTSAVTAVTAFNYTCMPPAAPPPPPTSAGPAGTAVGVAPVPNGGGYWVAWSNGYVTPHGNAANLGNAAGTQLNQPITHIVSTSDGGGYWLVAADGGTFAFGDAGFFGSMGGRPLNAPVVDLAPTRDGRGYWLVASDGGIFAFGDAQFRGSMGGVHLNRPVVGISADVQTGGYWEVAGDGGIFAFGAPFYGSTGGIVLNQPVNGMASAGNDDGYLFVASDGGIFAFGQAAFHGSLGSLHLNAPIVGMALDPATGGYWLVGADGGVFAFDAPFLGVG